MSFKCDGCGQPQPNGRSPKKILVAAQSVCYEVYIADQRRVGRRDDMVLVSSSEGYEAICGGEKKLCALCSPKGSGNSKPEIVGDRQKPVRQFAEKDSQYRLLNKSIKRDGRERAYA